MPKHNTQRVFGLQVVTNLLQHKPHIITAMWLDGQTDNSRLNELAALAEKVGIRVQPAAAPALKKISKGGFHQGVVADIQPDNLFVQQDLNTLLADLPEQSTLLMLDGVQDPHNLGACLRSAESAGVAMVMIPKDRAADLTPVARRAASGAAELLSICRVTNVARAIRSCQQQGFWTVGTSDSAEKMFYDGEYSGKVLLVMGSEGEGMRRLTMDSCDQLLALPMAGKVSSLNVSVATGICLFEIQRQRMALNKNN